MRVPPWVVCVFLWVGYSSAPDKVTGACPVTTGLIIRGQQQQPGICDFLLHCCGLDLRAMQGMQGMQGHVLRRLTLRSQERYCFVVSAENARRFRILPVTGQTAMMYVSLLHQLLTYTSSAACMLRDILDKPHHQRRCCWYSTLCVRGLLGVSSLIQLQYPPKAVCFYVLSVD